MGVFAFLLSFSSYSEITIQQFQQLSQEDQVEVINAMTQFALSAEQPDDNKTVINLPNSSMEDYLSWLIGSSYAAKRNNCIYGGWPSTLVKWRHRKVCDRPHRQNSSYKKDYKKMCKGNTIACNPALFGSPIMCANIKNSKGRTRPTSSCFHKFKHSGRKIKDVAKFLNSNTKEAKKAGKLFNELQSTMKLYCSYKNTVACKKIKRQIEKIKKGLATPKKIKPACGNPNVPAKYFVLNKRITLLTGPYSFRKNREYLKAKGKGLTVLKRIGKVKRWKGYAVQVVIRNGKQTPKPRKTYYTSIKYFHKGTSCTDSSLISLLPDIPAVQRKVKKRLSPQTEEDCLQKPVPRPQPAPRLKAVKKPKTTKRPKVAKKTETTTRPKPMLRGKVNKTEEYFKEFEQFHADFAAANRQYLSKPRSYLRQIKVKNRFLRFMWSKYRKKWGHKNGCLRMNKIITALTAHGEARGEGEGEMAATIKVMSNRATKNVRTNAKIVTSAGIPFLNCNKRMRVALANKQFSVWNHVTYKNGKVAAVMNHNLELMIYNKPKQSFKSAIKVVLMHDDNRIEYAGGLQNMRVLNYHADYFPTPSSWKAQKRRVYGTKLRFWPYGQSYPAPWERIRKHIFWRSIK